MWRAVPFHSRPGATGRGEIGPKRLFAGIENDPCRARAALLSRLEALVDRAEESCHAHGGG